LLLPNRVPQMQEQGSTIPERTVSGNRVVGEIDKPMISYYIGESARNGFTRGLEHQDAAKKRQTNNALVDFDMWLTSTHNDPLTRQIQEGVNIVMGEHRDYKKDAGLELQNEQ